MNEGELTRAQAACEKHKVKLTPQDIASAPDAFARLPQSLRDLVSQSLRLQARIVHLDGLLNLPRVVAAKPPSSPVAAQMDRLRSAFG